MAAPADITRLLAGLNAGDEECRARFVSAAYGELKRIAAAQMRGEKPDHTLQPSALVNELYLRMIGRKGAAWENRGHFFSVAASTMRRILIDHARGRRAKKRDGARERVELDRLPAMNDDGDGGRLIALDAALEELARLDPRQARVVEMRFFAGLTMEQIADALGLSSRTVKRDWTMARAWLQIKTGGGA